jgi:hypothetical protein
VYSSPYKGCGSLDGGSSGGGGISWTWAFQSELLSIVAAFLTVLRLTLVQGHQSFITHPPLPEGGPIQADPVSATSEAPEADESQDGDDAKVSLEENSSTTSPPPAHSKEPSLDKKRKRVEELLSLSTSAPKTVAREPSAPNPSKVKFLTFWTRESC